MNLNENCVSVFDDFLRCDKILNLGDTLLAPEVYQVIEEGLVLPLKFFLKKPGKQIRKKLVEVGFGCVKNTDQILCDDFSLILEVIHAGSLIIDDIEDQSEFRRGQKALHKKFGEPIALNAGNWLYFLSSKILDELTEKHSIGADIHLKLYKEIQDTMYRAHIGQTIDLGVDLSRVVQPAIKDICLSALRLKTGALTALAIKIGGLIANANSNQMQVLNEFGYRFGMTLQMFDDLGAKKFSDLSMMRPSWLWCVAAIEFNSNEYAHFVDLVSQLSRDSKNFYDLDHFFAECGFIKRANERARLFFDDACSLVLESKEFDPLQRNNFLASINHLRMAIEGAYV